MFFQKCFLFLLLQGECYLHRTTICYVLLKTFCCCCFMFILLEMSFYCLGNKKYFYFLSVCIYICKHHMYRSLNRQMIMKIIIIIIIIIMIQICFGDEQGKMSIVAEAENVERSERERFRILYIREN